MRGLAAGSSILIGVIAATPALAQAPAAQPATWEVKVEPAFLFQIAHA